MSNNPQLDRDVRALVDELSRMVLAKVRVMFAEYRPNLSRGVGAVPPGSLPPASQPAHVHPEYATDAELADHADNIASTTVLGHVKKGANVNIDGTGVLTHDGNATALQGRAVAADAPTNGQALVYDTAQTRWEPGTIQATVSVREVDGTPNVANVTTIKVGNADLVDEGGGVVRVRTASDATTNPADEPPSSPNAMDDEFNDSTLDAKWLWLNQGPITVVEANGKLSMTSNETVNQHRGIYQAMPAGACRFRAKLYSVWTSSTDYISLWFGQSTTQEIRAVGIWNGVDVRGISHTSPTGTQTAWGLVITRYPEYIYAEIEWTGTEIICRASTLGDSDSYVEIVRVTPGYTPTLVGLGFTNRAGAELTAKFGWFRRVS